MNTIEQLIYDGAAKGLCAPWKRKIKAEMKIEALVGLFIKGIDFCISEDYPTLDFMREHFRGRSEEYGVFIDDDIIGRKNEPDTVLNGSCKAMLEYMDYSVSRVFVRHNSKAAINASGHAYVTVDAFDKSEIVAATSGNAKILINLYGDAKVECIGVGITVKFIQKPTY